MQLNTHRKNSSILALSFFSLPFFTFAGSLPAQSLELNCELRKEIRTGYFELVETAVGKPGAYNPVEKIATIAIDDGVQVTGRVVQDQLTLSLARSEEDVERSNREFGVSTTTLDRAAHLRFDYNTVLGYQTPTWLFACQVSGH